MRVASRVWTTARVISGIVHVLKSGGRWVDAPAVYCPRKTLCNRFVRWAEKGVWTNIFHALGAAGGPPAQPLIDSSAVKAHRSASGGKGGRSIRRSVVRAVGAPRKSTHSPTISAVRSRSS
jgi:transposase